jgi:PAS domain S-box-containing protein
MAGDRDSTLSSPDSSIMDSRRLFQQIAETTPEILFIHDLVEQRNVYANPELVKRLGYTPEQMLSMGPSILETIIHPDDLPRVAGDLSNYDSLPEGAVVDREYRVQRSDGVYRWVRSRTRVFSRDADGRARQVLGVAQDITEAKAAQEAIRASEERYRAFISQSSEGIWRFELDEPIPTSLPEAEQIDLIYKHAYLAECNEAMARMYGYSAASDLIGARLGDMLVRTEPRNVEYLRDFIRSSYRLKDAESAEVDRHGNQKYFLNSLTGIIEDGRILRAWGVQIDVTDRKHAEAASRASEARFREELARQVEERTRALELASQERSQALAELHQARNLEAVGRLAGGIAHDFNNLMTGIIGMCEELLSGRELSNARQSEVGIIREAAQRATALTKQLLAFGRRQIIEPQVINLNETLASLQPLVDRLIGADIQVSFRPGTDLRPVRMDPSQVEQILLNLVMNSRDAMRQGGSIVIETQNTALGTDDQSRHFQVDPGAYVMLKVSDTGVGMDPETRAHAFEPFFTTKPRDKGTGLGLATVYGIVKQNGGDIQLESEPGRGTTLRVYFPIAGGEPTPVASSLDRPVPKGRETVLVVEDEGIVRKVTTRALEKYGYRVLQADSGQAALGVASAFEGSIELLLTDVVMPGMNGQQLQERLSPTRPQMRVLYMSGYGENIIASRGLIRPGISFIEKSFTAEMLCRKVREVLDAPPKS